jgi:hypothetical protein
VRCFQIAHKHLRFLYRPGIEVNEKDGKPMVAFLQLKVTLAGISVFSDGSACSEHECSLPFMPTG